MATVGQAIVAVAADPSTFALQTEVPTMRAARRNRRPTRKSLLPRVEGLEPRMLLAAGIGVFDAATDTFSLRNQASAGTADAEFQFNAQGTIPVVADWNGDHQDDFGVFNPATATWSL